MMGEFNYDAAPLGLLGCPVMIHKKKSNRNSWNFCSKEGWSVGVSFEHYRCQLVIPADTQEINVSDTVEILHKFITTPTRTPEYCILHGLNTLSGTIKDVPTATFEAQIKAITKLRDICTGWAGIDALAHLTPPTHPPSKSQVHELTSQPHRFSRVE